MSATSIEWATDTWNPLVGCTKISAGCANCYAASMASRFSGEGHAFEGTAARGNWTGRILLKPDKLYEPLRWKKPRRVFVNSMSDLFHEGVSDAFIASVFAVMACCPQHTFMVLTKRPQGAFDWFHKMAEDPRYLMSWALERQPINFPRALNIPLAWPLPNVWLGVSVENQQTADERIPWLLKTPAAVRFLSCEPLLSSVNLLKYLVGGSQDDNRRDGNSGIGGARCSVCGQRGARVEAPGDNARVIDGRERKGVRPEAGGYRPIEEGRVSQGAGDDWQGEIHGPCASNRLDGGKPTGNPGGLRHQPQGWCEGQQPPIKPRTDDARGKLDSFTAHIGQLPEPQGYGGEVDAGAGGRDSETVRCEDYAPCPNCGTIRRNYADSGQYRAQDEMGLGSRARTGISWLIVGGESGPKARPMHPDWARELRDQCAAAGVPYFFKQWGEWGPVEYGGPDVTDDGMPCVVWPAVDHHQPCSYCHAYQNAYAGGPPCSGRYGKRAAGRLLDGIEHNAFPEVTP